MRKTTNDTLSAVQISSAAERDANEYRVELWDSPLPFGLGWLASHAWFLIYEPAEERWHRWEGWQVKQVAGRSIGLPDAQWYGYICRDLMPLHRGMRGGPANKVHEWQGAEAERLYAVINNPAAYPCHDQYRVYPGPNSNTYIAWCLLAAHIPYRCHPRIVGAKWAVRRVGTLCNPALLKPILTREIATNPVSPTPTPNT